MGSRSAALVARFVLIPRLARLVFSLARCARLRMPVIIEPMEIARERKEVTLLYASMCMRAREWVGIHVSTAKASSERRYMPDERTFPGLVDTYRARALLFSLFCFRKFTDGWLVKVWRSLVPWSSTRQKYIRTRLENMIWFLNAALFTMSKSARKTS